MATTSEIQTTTAMQQTPIRQINKTTRSVPEELRYAETFFPEFFTPATINSAEKQNQEALVQQLAKKSLLRADIELLLSLQVLRKE